MTNEKLLIGGLAALIIVFAFAVLFTSFNSRVNELNSQVLRLNDQGHQQQLVMVQLASDFQTELQKRDVVLYALKTQLDQIPQQIQSAITNTTYQILAAIDDRLNQQAARQPYPASAPSYVDPYSYSVSSSSVYVASAGSRCVQLEVARTINLVACRDS